MSDDCYYVKKLELSEQMQYWGGKYLNWVTVYLWARCPIQTKNVAVANPQLHNYYITVMFTAQIKFHCNSATVFHEEILIKHCFVALLLLTYCTRKCINKITSNMPHFTAI